MLLWLRTRVPALVGIGALVVLAGVVARGRSAVPVGESKPLFGWLRLPEFRIPESRDGVPNDWAPEVHGGWIRVFEWAILMLPLLALVFAIGAAVVVAVLRGRRLGPPTPVVTKRGEPGGSGDRTGALVRAARSARRVLAEHEGGPPGDAVIAAWLELERAAEESEHGRQAHQTPTEFTDALVAEHAAIRRAVDELRALYHRARFGRPGEVGEREAEAARRALDEITASLVVR